jgi:GTPase SAR1 family protein
MQNINTIVTIIAIIVGTFGIIIGIPTINNLISIARPNHSIAIFGPKAAGKTTLIKYLQGKPLPEEHKRTFGLQNAGKIVFDLGGKSSLYFLSKEMYDVGGEHTNQWKVIIENQNPDAIIYIIDTNSEEDEKEGLKIIFEIYHEILSRKEMSKIKLKTILLFLNKCDIWGNTINKRSKKIAEYKVSLRRRIIAIKSEFGGIKILFGCGSLTDPEYRQLTNDVLRQLAESIAMKERT